MKRSLYALAAAAMLAATVTATANAATSVDLRVSVGDRYHGATLAFTNEPEVVLVPDTKVYYVQHEDCDLYRYGRYWYFVEDGFWYRSTSWRGPFLHIRTATVPRSVVYVPVKYRRHWRGGPPEHAVAQGYYKNRGDDRGNRGDDRGNRNDDRDRGQGRGKHHGR
jgi:hypothetical protein